MEQRGSQIKDSIQAEVTGARRSAGGGARCGTWGLAAIFLFISRDGAWGAGVFRWNDVRLSYASGSPDLKHFGTAKDVAAAAAKRASPSTDGETSHTRYPAFSPDRPCMWIVEKPTIPLFVAVFPANR
jgi:hypothetical protein